MRCVLGHPPEDHRPQGFLVVVQHHPVVEHREVDRPDQFVAVENWGLEDNVVRLPFARLAAGIHEWRPLAIDGPRMAVGVGGVIVAVQDLDLLALHEQDAAVPASLAAAFDHGGRGPFEVELD